MYTQYLSEFIGTLIFVLAIVLTSSPLLVAGTFLAVILLIGPFSGGHINPAVTLAMLFKGDMTLATATPYIVAQVAGALAAIQVAKYLKARL
jgi:glycerol uptake facilitator-like aquaporin